MAVAAVELRSGAPDPYVVLALRDEIADAARRARALARTVAAPLPAGPLTPALHRQLTDAYVAASIAASDGSGVASMLDALRKVVDVPKALDLAVEAMSYSADSLRCDSGYLHGIVDANTMPPEQGTPMFAQIRTDAAAMTARAVEAARQLAASGWLRPGPTES